MISSLRSDATLLASIHETNTNVTFPSCFLHCFWGVTSSRSTLFFCWICATHCWTTEQYLHHVHGNKVSLWTSQVTGVALDALFLSYPFKIPSVMFYVRWTDKRAKTHSSSLHWLSHFNSFNSSQLTMKLNSSNFFMKGNINYDYIIAVLNH